jgi:hypothetical protein
VRLTVFSLEEANRAVVELRPRLERLVEARRAYERVGRRIDVLSVALSGAGPGNPDRAERVELEQRRVRLGREITAGLREVQERGCLVKDLERGLLDFYAISGDRLIFLCWQLGEREITHWHTLDGGFASRQPLDASDL